MNGRFVPPYFLLGVFFPRRKWYNGSSKSRTVGGQDKEQTVNGMRFTPMVYKM